MVSAVAPYAIVLGVIGTIGLAVFALWERVERFLERFAGGFAVEIERADLRMSAQHVGALLGLVTVSFWTLAIVASHPDPARAVLYIPICFAASAVGFRTWIRSKSAKRLKAFNEQLELVLRLISSGLRVGLEPSASARPRHR